MDAPIEVLTAMHISGEIAAENVSYEDFLRDFDGEHVEWIDGVVIRMSPITSDHNLITGFLFLLFKHLLALTGGGEVFTDPMIMRLETSRRGRAPDIQVLLPHKLHLIRKNEIAGAADLVVEVVSEDSQRRDRVEKFTEYERGRVPEYWILDPLRRESLFNSLGGSGLYELRPPDENGIYTSVVLPGLYLPADIFWRHPLPDAVETFRMAEAMMRD
jgi:Uma2 family endonuclease